MERTDRICKNESCKNRVEGRVDRVFCSSYCKSDHHARILKQSGRTLFKLEVDSVLKRNRSILAKFNLKSKTTVRKEVLLAEGFNPRVFTHFWKTSKGETYLFCYDQGFKEIKDNFKDKYLLVIWQPAMANQVFGRSNEVALK